MDSIFVIIFILIIFGTIFNYKVQAVATERTHTHNNYNTIQRPQFNGIQKLIQKLGIVYNIPENTSFQDYYRQYKQNTTQTIEIQSPNFPKPYPVNVKTNYTILVENSTGIELIVHVLDINGEKDYLKFTPIYENDNNIRKPVLILTGNQMNPIKFRIFSTTKLEIEFGAYANENHGHKGFFLSYTPYGDLPVATTRPPDIQLPFDELQDYRALIIVPEDQQTNTTWRNFRNLLCNATNNWAANINLQLENCQSNNVTFKSISKCPKLWPNYLTCIQLIFAISLYSNEQQVTTVNPLVQESTPKYPAALTKLQLENMWNQYGKVIFEEIGIYEYQLPDVHTAIILWICIGSFLLLIMLIVLFFVCRLSVFKDYMNWSTNDDDKENILDKSSEFDITMIPSPEQIIPDVVERYANGLLVKEDINHNMPMFSEGGRGREDENEKKKTTQTAGENSDDKRNSSSLGGVTNRAFVNDEEGVLT